MTPMPVVTTPGPLAPLSHSPPQAGQGHTCSEAECGRQAGRGEPLSHSYGQINRPALLPTREGVGPSCIVLPENLGLWPTVIDFLAHRFPSISREEVMARMQRGDVVDEMGAFISTERKYQPHLKLFYYRSIAAEVRIPFDEVVLFQDDYLIAVDKPHFLPVTPGGRYLQETLLVRLKRKYGIETLAPMHRIDRETAGVVLFTIQPSTRGAYQNLFSQRAITKRYQAIAPFRADLKFPMTVRSRLVESEHFMRMREVDGEPNAETCIELLEATNQHARYCLKPVTGKKHQLRVQMAALGIPILNDQIYPEHRSKEQNESDDYTKPLQLLAAYIAFTDPISGEQRCFESQRRLDAL